MEIRSLSQTVSLSKPALPNGRERPISEQLQHRWSRQLVNATAWLERSDYFHCDIRLVIVLLDLADHVKLCDFGNATKQGEELPSATEPFYGLKPDGQHSSVGAPVSSSPCIHTIRMGHQPLHHLSWREIMDALKRSEFPSTDSDPTFGGIIFDCWREGYETMAQLEQTITSTLKDCRCHEGATVMEPKVFEHRVPECVEFLVCGVPGEGEETAGTGLFLCDRAVLRWIGWAVDAQIGAHGIVHERDAGRGVRLE